jgi:hypothetical protein
MLITVEHKEAVTDQHYRDISLNNSCRLVHFIREHIPFILFFVFDSLLIAG